MSRSAKVLLTARAFGLLRGNRMGSITCFLVAMSAMAGVGMYLAPASGNADEDAVPIFVDKIPEGYRDWRLISVAHEEGSLKSIAAVLGNDVAIKAYREGQLPFPDGAIIAALHWHHVPSKENDQVFGRPQSFVPGLPTNVQFMIKDSRKYAATGGWGFGHFNERDGKPAEKAVLQSCFPCHQAIKARDLVFTRYSL
jgi:Cytochrome P460